MCARWGQIGLSPVFARTPAARSQQRRLHRQGRAHLTEPPVQRAEGGAMIRADREMQRVTGPQAERVLIGKPRGGTELRAGDRQQREVVPGFRTVR